MLGRPHALAAALALLAACSLTTSLDGLANGSREGSTPGDRPDATTTSDASADVSLPLTGWRFRKALTIDGAKVVSTSDLVGFPLLISTTDPDLKAVEHGGKLTSSMDLAFFAADGTTPLAHEIEQYSASTGQLIAWVKLPVLSKAGGKLFVYFGNPKVDTSLQDRRGVWTEGFAGVWHMSDAAWSDSAGTNDGTAIGGAQTIPTGRIGSGGSFGASNSNVDVGAKPSLQPKSITLSVWAQPQSVGSMPDRHPYMASQDTWRADGTNPRGYYIELYRTQSDPRPTFYTGNGSVSAHAFATTSLVNGTWYYVVGTRDEATGATRIYVNGTLQGSATMTGGIAYEPKALLLGGVGTQTWNGLLDELRISNVARSPGWVLTEYENQRSPETFVVTGGIETLAP